ncbi:MAG TPA: proton-conducting transporter membrane subunit [Pirellulales bacterium]|jgi:hydrogenase-4 component F|nr:proton-conducting transporter membrane subunit [Pirellulales bacterium]
MILALVCVPLVAGLIAFGWRSDAGRRMLLVLSALVHLGLTAACWIEPPTPMLDGWLKLDSLGLLFLSITSVLFLASSVYCLGYLGKEHGASHIDFEEHLFFSNEPEAVFTGCLLLFLASMTLVTVSQHFGLLWVGIEATTLASAPLIYFHRQHRSLEATWKYLLICSVGIALALLGNILLAAAAAGSGMGGSSLVLSDLLGAKMEHVSWLKASFLFFLVGYGTKMGLAPMHTWLPDAHSESPSLVSALLSGALLNCAFLGILRAHQVCAAAGQALFSQELLLFFGLLSMAVAAIFIIAQADYKRMLAYSSVEHMGILAIGVGLGGAGARGAALHAVNHSFTKAMLFLVAGNVLATFGTKSIRDVRGVLRVIPWSGVLWLAGFLAITGTPPFGPFLSEFTILKAALDHDRGWVAAIYLLFLAIIFVGMANSVLVMTQGPVTGTVRPDPRREGWWSILPPLGLSVVVLTLGLYIPPRLSALLEEAQQILSPADAAAAPAVANHDRSLR